MFGDFAPKLAELTDDVLFEDVWNRSELSARDRSLVTVAVLTSGGDTEQLAFHLGRAVENGVRIRVVMTDDLSPGVDTFEQARAVEQLIAAGRD